MLVIGMLALSVPAVTLASGGGGGSAGDQQYTDPFAGTPTSSSHTTTATAPASSAPTPTVAPATGTTTAQLTAGTTPTATIAATAANQLPYTGYDAWLAAGFGLAMVAGGLGLRYRTRGS
jgi:hypothetical protein